MNRQDPNELISNGDFLEGDVGCVPHGWEVVQPNPVLAPTFRLTYEFGRSLLLAEGNARQECFGYIRQAVSLQPGVTYCLTVRLRTEGMEDPQRQLVHGVFAKGCNDGVFTYRRDGEWVVGERRFQATGNVSDGEVRLYFRYSPHGKVWWDAVSLTPCEPIAPRHVRVACTTGRGDLAHWADWLDQAGQRRVDVALLPEFFNGKDAHESEPIDGPTGSLLAQKALEWGMYVSGTFYERRGDLVFNTAPVFDRRGTLLGIYSKNQLYDPEADAGVTPGIGYPVFDTDFGKVGIMICYDSWFPETSRLLAYKGAELVLFPNAGYFSGLMPARAADNGLWIAVSSLDGPAGIWEPGGGRAGALEADPTRHAPITSIHSYEEREHMVIATLDLSQRVSPHWWRGPMRSAPGCRRVRQTLIRPLEDEISAEARRWWE